MLVYFIGIGTQRRFISALHLGYLGASAALVIRKFIPLAQEGEFGQAWLWALGGLVLVLVLAGQAAFGLLDRYVLARWEDNKRNYTLPSFLLLQLLLWRAGSG